MSMNLEEVLPLMRAGRTVERDVHERWRLIDGATHVYSAGIDRWVPCAMPVSTHLDGCHIVKPTYDWAEARRRMAAGKTVQSCVGRYLVVKGGHDCMFTLEEIDGQWQDV